MAKTSYIVQKNGQVTLPLELREEYGLSVGDEVTFLKGDDGWIISKPEPDPLDLLDQLGDALKTKGITLDQLMADGRDIRGELVKEIYGLSNDATDET